MACQCAIALAAVALGGPVARAADGVGEDAPALYEGAFWGVSLKGGLALRLDGGAGEGPGPAFGASLRAATLLSLLDVELSVLHARYEARSTAAHIDVARTSVALEVHLHPLFISHLQGGNWSYLLGALHVTLGGALELVAGPGDVQAAPGLLVGAGVDIPLGDVLHGWGLWLGVDYRFRLCRPDGFGPGLGDFDEHVVLVSLGYRNNDIGFARVPRPPELDDRDPLPR
ncbi:MAG: hypothetical protein KC635_06195 [Myxococcales bacterium]|nr:hypothetical protein [Myxococcales bacterium]MCB9733410.1 hypothetical protein [Deltaproteobacteria bacterium]